MRIPPILPMLKKNLVLSSEGIWLTKTKEKKISYPEKGHQICLQIEDRSFWFKHRNQIIVEAIKHFPPNGPIYDLGGGNGFVSLALKKAGFEPILVEPGIEGARNGKRRGISKVICATLADIEFPKNSIPAIGMFDVLEHIQKDQNFLALIYKLLQPKGRLYLTVPAYSWLWSKDDTAGGHFRRYIIKNLQKILANANFKILYASYFFSILPLPIFLFRTIPSKLGLIKNKKNISDHCKEHTAYNGFIKRVIESLLKWEVNYISKKKKIPFGGSILLVAEKKLSQL